MWTSKAKQRRLHSKWRLIDMGDSTPLTPSLYLTFARLPQGLVALKYSGTSEASLVGLRRNYWNSAVTLVWMPRPLPVVHFCRLDARCFGLKRLNWGTPYITVTQYVLL